MTHTSDEVCRLESSYDGVKSIDKGGIPIELEIKDLGPIEDNETILSSDITDIIII
jgi:hypothetical protein